MGYASSELICPQEDIDNTRCTGPMDCLYPFPGDCSKFYVCEVDEPTRKGVPTERDCPSSFEWNDNIKRCDYPENSDCPRNRPSSPSA